MQQKAHTRRTHAWSLAATHSQPTPHPPSHCGAGANVKKNLCGDFMLPTMLLTITMRSRESQYGMTWHERGHAGGEGWCDWGDTSAS